MRRRAQALLLIDGLQQGQSLAQFVSRPDFAPTFTPAHDPAGQRRVASMLEQAVAADEDVEGFALRLYMPLLTALIRRIARPTPAFGREDYLQEAKLKCLISLRYLAQHGVRPDGNPLAYLLRAVVNRLLDLNASSTMRERDEDDQDQVESHRTTRRYTPANPAVLAASEPATAAEREAFWQELRQIVGPQHAQLLADEHVHERPQAQIAADLGVTARTVRNRLAAARLILKAHPQFRQEWEENWGS